MPRTPHPAARPGTSRPFASSRKHALLALLLLAVGAVATIAADATSCSSRRDGRSRPSIGLALPALPFLPGFSELEEARNFYFGFTALTFILASLTDSNASSAPRRGRRTG
jgi:hypothetical protein